NAAYGFGNADLAGNERLILPRLRMREQRCILSQHAEGEGMGCGVFDAVGWGLGHGIGLQPPYEHADGRNVVASLTVRRADAANVNRMRQRIEGAVNEVERFDFVQIDTAPAIHMQVIQVLIPQQELEKLPGSRGPSGDIVREFFEYGESAFAAARADSVGGV